MSEQTCACGEKFDPEAEDHAYTVIQVRYPNGDVASEHTCQSTACAVRVAVAMHNQVVRQQMTPAPDPSDPRWN